MKNNPLVYSNWAWPWSRQTCIRFRTPCSYLSLAIYISPFIYLSQAANLKLSGSSNKKLSFRILDNRYVFEAETYKHPKCTPHNMPHATCVVLKTCFDAILHHAIQNRVNKKNSWKPDPICSLHSKSGVIPATRGKVTGWFTYKTLWHRKRTFNGVF